MAVLPLRINRATPLVPVFSQGHVPTVQDVPTRDSNLAILRHPRRTCSREGRPASPFVPGYLALRYLPGRLDFLIARSVLDMIAEPFRGKTRPPQRVWHSVHGPARTGLGVQVESYQQESLVCGAES
jgi:hypothetical protein